MESQPQNPEFRNPQILKTFTHACLHRIASTVALGNMSTKTSATNQHIGCQSAEKLMIFTEHKEVIFYQT